MSIQINKVHKSITKLSNSKSISIMALRHYLQAKQEGLSANDKTDATNNQIFKRPRPQPCSNCKKCHCTPEIDDLENLPQQLLDLKVREVEYK